MSRALEGVHYCKGHQGNHSHYDPKNCALCKAEGALAYCDAILESRIADLERLRREVKTVLIEIKASQT